MIPFSKTRLVASCNCVLLLILVSCGGGGGGSDASSSTSRYLDYSKFREYMQPPVAGDPGDLRPVLSESGSGFDSDEVDGPSVVDHPSRPNGDRWMMWYEATDAAGVISIGLVTSDEDDFAVLTIDRAQAVHPSDDPGLGAFDVGATDPTVVLDRRSTTPASERYKMWFEGRSGAGGSVSQIVYCDSADGITWNNFTVCTGLTPGVDVSYGDRVQDPAVVLDQDSGGDLYRMWFEAVDEGGDGSGQIFYADSADRISWIVRDAAGGVAIGAGPVITPGFGGVFSAFTVGAPSVFLVEDAIDNNVAFHLWYTGGDVPTSQGTEDKIGYATSADGLSWIQEASLTPDFLPVLKPTSDSIPDPNTGLFEWDSGDVRQPSAWIDVDLMPTESGAFLLWYAGDVENGGPNSPNRIGLARGRNP